MKTKKYRWDAALKRLPKNKKVRLAEVGVWCGNFSEQILKQRPLSKIIQVDRWTVYTPDEQLVETEARMSRYSQVTFDKAYHENLHRIAPFPKRVHIFKMDSIAAAAKIKDASLDLIFIDGAHSYQGCLADIIAYLPKIRRGGYIGGHDFPRRPGVKRAVYEMFKGKVEMDFDATWWVNC